jgi:hypothetical protein
MILGIFRKNSDLIFISYEGEILDTRLMQRLKRKNVLVLQDVKNTSESRDDRWDPPRLCEERGGRDFGGGEAKRKEKRAVWLLEVI